MQTLVMILLLFTSTAVAFFNARELFAVWYSVTSPTSTRHITLVVVELVLCVLLVGVMGARLYYNGR